MKNLFVEIEKEKIYYIQKDFMGMHRGRPVLRYSASEEPINIKVVDEYEGDISFRIGENVYLGSIGKTVKIRNMWTEVQNGVINHIYVISEEVVETERTKSSYQDCLILLKELSECPVEESDNTKEKWVDSFYKIMGGVLLGFLLFSFIHML